MLKEGGMGAAWFGVLASSLRHNMVTGGCPLQFSKVVIISGGGKRGTP